VSGIQSLIDEVETSFRTGTTGSRAATLRRITDLFLQGAETFKDEQVGVFDDVLCRLVDQIERGAIAELSTSIAALSKAPPVLSRRLARHDDITIAGPVLKQSPVLSDNDLVELARSKGQLHLEAIASRSHVSEKVSDVLIDRGNSEVLTTVARNFGARFSSRGYKTLLGKAESDAKIASALITRPDLSPEMFRKLIAQATATVQQRLLLIADPAMKEQLQGVIQAISVQLTTNADRQIELGGAPPASQRHVQDMAKLRAELADYATAGRPAETVTALATISGLPADTIRRLLTQQEHDALLIICKANGLGWLTVRAVLELSAGTKGNFGINSAGYLDQYTRMSRESAERVIRFLKVRKSASPTELKKMLAS
jgi:uncharacterized protein (DUF2336 family)